MSKRKAAAEVVKAAAEVVKAAEQEEEEEEAEEKKEEGESGSGSGSSDGESGSGSGDDDDEEDGFPEVSDGDEDEDGDEEDGEKQEEIIIDFEFFPPKEIDFHGLKSLLLTYLDGQQYDSSGLVNTILEQGHVGSVVKTAEDDDPIAVFTVLNTHTHKDQEWLTQLREFLESKAGDANNKKQLQEAFSQPGTGLLINERLINSPPKLAPPLMQFLFNEIKSAAQDQELSKQEREQFDFKRFLVATRVYSDTERGGSGGARGEAGPSSSKGSKPLGKKQKTQGDDVLVYLRPEDEFLHKSCAWSYTFPVEGRPVGKDDLLPLRMVMMVEASKITAVRKALDAVVGNMAAGQ